MRSSSIGLLAAATALSALLGSSAAASADPTVGIPPTGSVSPVTINTCGPILNNSPGTQVAGIQLAQGSSGIRIEFVNESTKTADLVNFAIDSNGQQFVIRDVGTFSPGISIKHEFKNGYGQAFVLPAFIAPHVKCSVSSVKFTDGTLWEPGQATASAHAPPPPAARAAISADPPSVQINRTADSELFFVKSSERITAFKETDNCTGIASVYVAATGQSSATYTVKPLATGQCTATITDEAGNTLAVPVAVR